MKIGSKSYMQVYTKLVATFNLSGKNVKNLRDDPTTPHAAFKRFMHASACGSVLRRLAARAATR